MRIKSHSLIFTTIGSNMPSYMKSTLSQMAMISLIWVLIFAWYSVVTWKEINLPDWIVAVVSSIITSYVQSRNNDKKDTDLNQVPDKKLNEPESKKDNDSKLFIQ